MPDAEIQYDPAAVDKVLKKGNGDGLNVLRELLPVLQAVGEWTSATIEQAINAFGESKGFGLGKIAQPIRVAISGGTISPPIFDSLQFLGREKTLNRIARASKRRPPSRTHCRLHFAFFDSFAQVSFNVTDRLITSRSLRRIWIHVK